MGINYNPFSLEGKTILVTGASSGIGRATAIECSKMGATLIITGRNAQRLQETYDALDGKNHKQIVADLAEQKGINFLVTQLSSLDGAVLCAGIGQTLPFQFSTREKFDKVFNINFFSPVELLRLIFKKKILAKKSSVVIIASIDGIYCASVCNGIYGATKSAINAIMKFSAKEFALSRQIRVNCICPGMIDTPLIHSGSITKEQLEADKKRYPLQHYGEPEDVAYAAIYLLSDAASFVTGQDIVVDGGVTI